MWSFKKKKYSSDSRCGIIPRVYLHVYLILKYFTCTNNPYNRSNFDKCHNLHWFPCATDSHTDTHRHTHSHTHGQQFSVCIRIYKLAFKYHFNWNECLQNFIKFIDVLNENLNYFSPQNYLNYKIYTFFPPSVRVSLSLRRSLLFARIWILLIFDRV